MPIGESDHELIDLRGRPLPVHHPDVDFGNDVAKARCHRFDVFDARTHEKALSTTAVFGKQCLAHQTRFKWGYDGLDGRNRQRHALFGLGANRITALGMYYVSRLG